MTVSAVSIQTKWKPTKEVWKATASRRQRVDTSGMISITVSVFASLLVVTVTSGLHLGRQGAEFKE